MAEPSRRRNNGFFKKQSKAITGPAPIVMFPLYKYMGPAEYAYFTNRLAFNNCINRRSVADPPTNLAKPLATNTFLRGAKRAVVNER